MQIVKPGGRLVVTLARDRFLKRYHFFTFYWDGRSRDSGAAPPGRYKLRVKLLDQDRVLVPPGAMRLHRAPREPLTGCDREPGGRLERRPGRPAGARSPRPAPARRRSCSRPAGPRSAAMLAALVLFPVLILGDQWHSHQIVDLRDDSTRFAALGPPGPRDLGGPGGRLPPLADPRCRWRSSPPSPSASRSHAGGDTANLLVPLYLVIAGGVARDRASNLSRLAGPARAARPSGRPRASARRTPSPRQDPPANAPSSGSPGSWPRSSFSTPYRPCTRRTSRKSLQNVCFFFVPFSLVFALLRDVEWDRRLLVGVLWVIGLEAVAFVAIGTVEYATRSLFWNDQVIRSNEFHTYFRVNSVFWDPNVYGRWLALAIVVAMAALLWARERRDQALLTALVAVLWIGLAPTFSQSSFIALLAGLAVLAALRWSLRWTLAAVGAGAVAAVLVVLLAGGSSVSVSRINIDTCGRANLVSGGIHLFAQRPVYGYGSGSFPRAYREHVDTDEGPGLDLPHRADHGRRRAGGRRARGIRRPAGRGAMDDGRVPASLRFQAGRGPSPAQPPEESPRGPPSSRRS